MGIQNTVFGMSHTHSAGDTIGVYGHYPAAFIGHIQEAVVAGLADAMQRLEPVSEVRAAARELPMDGARVMGLIRNARNPAVMDPTVNLVQILGAGGKPIASIAQLTCHPESIEAGVAEIDADYPGYLCAAMKAADMGQPVFLNGALGGMVSGDNPERTHESSKEVGEKLATIMKDLEGEAQPIGGSSLRAETRRLELPLTNENFKPLMESGLRELNQGRIVTDMTYIALGDAQFVSLPGEVLPEVSFEILEQMNGFPRVLIGLGNDQLGYIIPAYDFRDGVYEESMSVGPATAYSVRDMALRMVREKM
ncbi:MAG: hypothetical protein GC168_06330 [Candidatus Hydrogenedens sp.]|nr:hypothetical protein [Candidatus Hydrogenedens sp.]